MTDKRKIEILQKEIDNLKEENGSLREENKRLYEQIHIIQDSETEHYDSVHNAIDELNQKKNELDDLIFRCKQTKENYEELNREMSLMMSDYKRDMMEVSKENGKRLFGEKRKR